MSGSVSILVYVVLCIVLSREHFGGISSSQVRFGGVGCTCDGWSFSTVHGALPDWFCCFPDLHLADLMPSGTTWRPWLFIIPTREVGCLNWLAVV